ncbi:MAG: DEAD/DEAH box helicase, partial [Myxococcota bacterium]
DLQCLSEDRIARHDDDVHDLLRRLGDLSAAELADRHRAADDQAVAAAIDRLARARRIAAMRIGGEDRWVAVEDVAIYRDALGAVPPPGVPEVFLEPARAPMEALLTRWSATRGPYLTAEVAARYRLPAGQLAEFLAALESRGVLLSGEFRPGGTEREWCHPDVLRRIKRRTLAKLRGEVAPVEAETMGRFLPAWHGIGSGRGGLTRLEEVLVQLEGLPLSYAELEAVILPARVADFSPRMLDELGAMGWLVWVGHGALGAGDGRVALYRRDRVARLFEAPAPPESLDAMHRAVLDHLEQRGASFFVALQSACAAARPGAAPTMDEVLATLWDLVWAGLVTNDTFQPLRALGRVKPAKAARARRGKRASTIAASGRWSLVSELLGPAVRAEEIAHSRAVKLLERHGIVSREVTGIEPMTGGFSATYRVLKLMEEAGKVRRGYFIEGLGGAQFAFPGAVDRLRGTRVDSAPDRGRGRDSDSDDERRGDSDGERVVLLSAIDPANPYGWLLPWPGPAGDGDRADEAGGEGGAGDSRAGMRAANGARPRRIAGAVVVLVAGEAVLFIDKGGRRLLTFPAAAARERLVEAARALEPLARRRRGKYLRLDTIDGEAARTSRHTQALLEAGFFADHRGLVLEAKTR